MRKTKLETLKNLRA